MTEYQENRLKIAFGTSIIALLLAVLSIVLSVYAYNRSGKDLKDAIKDALPKVEIQTNK
jgi:hypothetical protein